MNEFDLVLPTAVDVREVGMRDGLQLEDPSRSTPSSRCSRRWSPPASGGSRRRRSSPPRPCPRWPTPTRWPRSSPGGATCTGPRWLRTPAAPPGPSTPASPTSSTSSPPPTATAAPTPGERPPRRSTRSARSPASRTAPAVPRGHHRHRLGLPLRRSDADHPHGRRRPRGGDRGRRPALPGRHDRDDDAAARGAAARCGPPRLPGGAGRRALPRHPRHRSGQRTGRRPGRGHAAGLLDRRPRRLPVRPRGQRQHRHRGAGLHARGVRRPHRAGPRRGPRRRPGHRAGGRPRAAQLAVPGRRPVGAPVAAARA